MIRACLLSPGGLDFKEQWWGTIWFRWKATSGPRKVLWHYTDVCFLHVAELWWHSFSLCFGYSCTQTAHISYHPPPQTAEGFLIHFTTLHPFRADPRLILSQTPRWARLTYDSVHFWNTAALSSGVHLLFGTSESFILKSADVWLVCHRWHKQLLFFLGWGGVVLTPHPGELQLR